MNKAAKGRKGEKMAKDFLCQLGYSVLAENYRISRYGEIDLICQEKDILVFVEVKLRSTLNYGHPTEAVNYRKQCQLTKLANIYLCRTNRHYQKIRFDIISIIEDQDCLDCEIEHIKNAF